MWAGSPSSNHLISGLTSLCVSDSSLVRGPESEAGGAAVCGALLGYSTGPLVLATGVPRPVQGSQVLPP